MNSLKKLKQVKFEYIQINTRNENVCETPTLNYKPDLKSLEALSRAL